MEDSIVRKVSGFVCFCLFTVIQRNIRQCACLCLTLFLYAHCSSCLTHGTSPFSPTLKTGYKTVPWSSSTPRGWGRPLTHSWSSECGSHTVRKTETHLFQAFVWRFCLSSHRSERVENMTAREWQRSSFWFQQLGIEAEASCSTWQTLFMNAQQLEMVCFTPFGLPEILFVLYILKSWVTPHFFVFLRFCNQNNDLNAPNILTL